MKVALQRCRHYFCQCVRAEELCAMGLPEQAVALHRFNAEVACRKKQ